MFLWGSLILRRLIIKLRLIDRNGIGSELWLRDTIYTNNCSVLSAVVHSIVHSQYCKNLACKVCKSLMMIQLVNANHGCNFNACVW